MGDGDGPSDSLYQALVGLLHVAEVGDVEEDVLHEPGRARVCVGGREHEVLLRVHPGVDCLQFGQNTKLEISHILIKCERCLTLTSCPIMAVSQETKTTLVSVSTSSTMNARAKLRVWIPDQQFSTLTK